MHLVFPYEKLLVGLSLVPWILHESWLPTSKTAISNLASIASAVTISGKSSSMTHKKSTTRFPVSLRWTAYVTHKPVKESSETKSCRFSSKNGLFSKKVCYRVLYVKTFNGKVVRHSLFYLIVHKWLVGASPSTSNFWPKWPTACINGDFWSIFARSTSEQHTLHLSTHPKASSKTQSNRFSHHIWTMCVNIVSYSNIWLLWTYTSMTGT